MRTLILSCLLCLSAAPPALVAAPNGQQASVQDVNALAERISDSTKYLADIDQALAMAASGDYGRLQRGWQERLQAARDRIADLLEGHASARELPAEDRLAIYDAQKEIDSILNSHDKNRMVCRKVFQTGSRLTKATECLTVAQREVRAQAARENVDKLQRTECIVSEGNPCGGGG